jgi:hypothetical protein
MNCVKLATAKTEERIVALFLNLGKTNFRMKKNAMGLLIISMLLCSTSFGKTSKRKPKKNPYENMVEYYICIRDYDKRPLWIEEVKPKGCLLWYSRYAPGGPAAESKLGLEFCQEIALRIRTNLEKANFNCEKRPNIELN